MLVISVISTKGGVGKTTLAVNTASELGYFGRVALIDLDPEGDESGALGFAQNARKFNPGGVAAFSGGGGPYGFNAARDVHELKVTTEERAIAEFRGAVEALGEVFGLVVDTRPDSGPGERLAGSLAHLVMVPITPGEAELAATRKVVERLLRTQAHNRTGYPKVAIAPCRWIRRGKLAERIIAEASGLGVPVLPVVYAKDSVATAYGQGLPVVPGRRGGGPEMSAQISAGLDLVRELIQWPAK